MDGTTEPLIAVIGHPIAGNPSQLAIERGLAHLQLDWRVLSFDVPAAHVEKALEGFSVLSMKGVLIGPSLGASASKWNQQRSNLDLEEMPPSDELDCFAQDQTGRWLASHQQQCLLAHLFDNVKASEMICLGDPPSTTDGNSHAQWFRSIGKLPSVENSLLNLEEPSIDALSTVKRIVVSPSGTDMQDLYEFEETLSKWSQDVMDGMVIDLGVENVVVNGVNRERVSVLRYLDLQSMWLVRCLQQWTGKSVPLEVISEAIEEYTGV